MNNIQILFINDGMTEIYVIKIAAAGKLVQGMLEIFILCLQLFYMVEIISK